MILRMRVTLTWLLVDGHVSETSQIGWVEEHIPSSYIAVSHGTITCCPRLGTERFCMVAASLEGSGASLPRSVAARSRTTDRQSRV